MMPLGTQLRQGVNVFETGVTFHVALVGYAMFPGVREQPGHCATCAGSSNELRLQAH